MGLFSKNYSKPFNFNKDVVICILKFTLNTLLFYTTCTLNLKRQILGRTLLQMSEQPFIKTIPLISTYFCLPKP